MVCGCGSALDDKNPVGMGVGEGIVDGTMDLFALDWVALSWDHWLLVRALAFQGAVVVVVVAVPFMVVAIAAAASWEGGSCF